MAEWRVETCKGAHTGTWKDCIDWQREMQGSFPTWYKDGEETFNQREYDLEIYVHHWPSNGYWTSDGYGEPMDETCTDDECYEVVRDLRRLVDFRDARFRIVRYEEGEVVEREEV